MHASKWGNGNLRTFTRMTSRWSSNKCNSTSHRLSRAKALLVLRFLCSSWEMSIFWMLMRCRASAISRLLLASRLYQVLRSIAGSFPRTRR